MLEVRAILTGTTGRWWEGRNRDAENRLVGTEGHREVESNWESSIDVSMLPCVKQLVSGKLLHTAGAL